MSLAWLDEPMPGVDWDARASARARQGGRLKPLGALGALEAIPVTLAGLQGTPTPSLERVHITVFCGDHGVVDEGVSAYPQTVTARMAERFAGDGTAIGVLARELAAPLEAVDVGMRERPLPGSGVIDARVGAGTSNCARAPAMTGPQRDRALAAGREAAARARAGGAQAFIGGEMGIGNTTAATALACALLGRAASRLVGPGAGLDSDGVRRKADVIERALMRSPGCDGPMDALAAFGGFEIAALTGAYVAAAQRGLPILVDGFIASVAALVAVRTVPGVGPWLIATHRSAEPAHDVVLNALALAPAIDLGMRLGEGSGAAVAVPVLRSACLLHRDMASLADAGLDTGADGDCGR